jgi:hypothetical protein
VCLRFNQAVAATVMKNCEPFVPGPALAMANKYGLSNSEYIPLFLFITLTTGGGSLSTNLPFLP